MKLETKDLSAFLEKMGEAMSSDKVELYKKVIGSSEIEDFKGPLEFRMSVQYPWESFISGFLKDKLKANHDLDFIYQNSRFIERHFQSIIEKVEGMACCADKSRTIINSLAEFYQNGTRIEFDYSQEYTFHLPNTVFKDHDSIIDFYSASRNLYYGNITSYITLYLKLVQTPKNTETDEII